MPEELAYAASKHSKSVQILRVLCSYQLWCVPSIFSLPRCRYVDSLLGFLRVCCFVGRNLTVEFTTERDAAITYNSMTVDSEPKFSGRLIIHKGRQLIM